MSLRTLPILLADRIGIFYFRLFLLSRKASNATIKLPKVNNKVKIPRKIVMISYAVMSATSLPMYSGKPVFKAGRLPPCHGCFLKTILTAQATFFNLFLHPSARIRGYILFSAPCLLIRVSRVRAPGDALKASGIGSFFRFKNINRYYSFVPRK